jgi:hypothetical protein
MGQCQTIKGEIIPMAKIIIKKRVSGLDNIISIAVYLSVICKTTNVMVNTSASIADKLCDIALSKYRAPSGLVTSKYWVK